MDFFDVPSPKRAPAGEPPPLGFVAPVIQQAGATVGRIIISGYEALSLSALPMTQSQPLRESLTRTRVRVDAEDDDKTRVVKVSDAIKCVENALNDAVPDTAEMAEIVDKIVAKVLIGLITQDFDMSEIYKILAEKITACIRAKALRQNIARVSGLRVVESRGRGRPPGAKNGTSNPSYSYERRGDMGAG